MPNQISLALRDKTT